MELWFQFEGYPSIWNSVWKDLQTRFREILFTTANIYLNTKNVLVTISVRQ